VRVWVFLCVLRNCDIFSFHQCFPGVFCLYIFCFFLFSCIEIQLLFLLITCTYYYSTIVPFGVSRVWKWKYICVCTYMYIITLPHSVNLMAIIERVPEGSRGSPSYLITYRGKRAACYCDCSAYIFIVLSAPPVMRRVPV